MNIAIYQFNNIDSECPSCNQGEAKLILSDLDRCKRKAAELYGEGHTFQSYMDRKDVAVDSRCIMGAQVRPAMERMLEDIGEGRIDIVMMTYMGALAADQYFILAFYLYLKKHNVRIATVREGEGIVKMLEEALYIYQKEKGIEKPEPKEAGAERKDTVEEAAKATIIMNEIDGSQREIDVVEAPEAFLRLQPGSMDACEKQGLKIYKDDNGDYYLAGKDGIIVASGIILIKSFLRFFVV